MWGSELYRSPGDECSPPCDFGSRGDSRRFFTAYTSVKPVISKGTRHRVDIEFLYRRRVLVTSFSTGLNTDCVRLYVRQHSGHGTRRRLYLSTFCLFWSLFYSFYFTIKFSLLPLTKPCQGNRGTKTDLYNMVIALLTAITIVVGMRIMEPF
jgi:hypothetical protein